MSVLMDMSNIDSKEEVKIASGNDLGAHVFLKQDNSTNMKWASEVPSFCKDEPCLLGVDEAGRGPVLGPMVYGICYCPLNRADELKKIGCADSKVLSEETREKIFETLCTESEYIGWAIEAISPNVICNGMLRRTKYSLNQLAQDATVGLIRRVLESGANIQEVFVDTVGPPEKYQERLLSIFPELKIVVAKKADATYPIVSAASICAKVSRDRAMRTWTFQEGMDIPHDSIGSGYPSDPATKKFIAGAVDPVFGYPQLIRFSWSTAAKLLEEKAALVEWEDADEDGKTPATPITSFFGVATKEKKKHAFFKKRNLSNTTNL